MGLHGLQDRGALEHWRDKLDVYWSEEVTQISNLDTNGLMGVRNGAAMELTEREAKLIQFIREFGFGSFTLDVQHGQPTLVREAIKNTKF